MLSVIEIYSINYLSLIFAIEILYIPCISDITSYNSPVKNYHPLISGEVTQLVKGHTGEHKSWNQDSGVLLLVTCCDLDYAPLSVQGMGAKESFYIDIQLSTFLTCSLAIIQIMKLTISVHTENLQDICADLEVILLGMSPQASIFSHTRRVQAKSGASFKNGGFFWTPSVIISIMLIVAVSQH